jgi:hypothetical protein
LCQAKELKNKEEMGALPVKALLSAEGRSIHFPHSITIPNRAPSASKSCFCIVPQTMKDIAAKFNDGFTSVRHARLSRAQSIGSFRTIRFVPIFMESGNLLSHPRDSSLSRRWTIKKENNRAHW